MTATSETANIDDNNTAFDILITPNSSFTYTTTRGAATKRIKLKDRRHSAVEFLFKNTTSTTTALSDSSSLSMSNTHGTAAAAAADNDDDELTMTAVTELLQPSINIGSFLRVFLQHHDHE